MSDLTTTTGPARRPPLSAVTTTPTIISASTPVALGLLITLIGGAFWLGGQFASIEERQTETAAAISRLVSIAERHDEQIHELRVRQAALPSP